MGLAESNLFDQTKFLNEWTITDQLHNNHQIWVNKLNPSIQLEECPIFAHSEDDITQFKTLFELRKNTPELVTAHYLKDIQKSGLCTAGAEGKLYVEKITLRLSEIQHVPYPDSLHLMFTALAGYRKLVREVGVFKVQEQQIGFTQSGQAKVWLDSDFASIKPAMLEHSEQSMVHAIVQLVNDNVDHEMTPNGIPSLISYVFENKETSGVVGFDEALISVREYANKYNDGQIPKHMECIRQVGVGNILKSLETTAKNHQTANQGGEKSNLLKSEAFPYRWENTRSSKGLNEINTVEKRSMGNTTGGNLQEILKKVQSVGQMNLEQLLSQNSKPITQYMRQLSPRNSTSPLHLPSPNPRASFKAQTPNFKMVSGNLNTRDVSVQQGVSKMGFYTGLEQLKPRLSHQAAIIGYDNNLRRNQVQHLNNLPIRTHIVAGSNQAINNSQQNLVPRVINSTRVFPQKTIQNIPLQTNHSEFINNLPRQTVPKFCFQNHKQQSNIQQTISQPLIPHKANQQIKSLSAQVCQVEEIKSNPEQVVQVFKQSNGKKVDEEKNVNQAQNNGNQEEMKPAYEPIEKLEDLDDSVEEEVKVESVSEDEDQGGINQAKIQVSKGNATQDACLNIYHEPNGQRETFYHPQKPVRTPQTHFHQQHAPSLNVTNPQTPTQTQPFHTSPVHFSQAPIYSIQQSFQHINNRPIQQILPQFSPINPPVPFQLTHGAVLPIRGVQSNSRVERQVFLSYGSVGGHGTGGGRKQVFFNTQQVQGLLLGNVQQGVVQRDLKMTQPQSVLYSSGPLTGHYVTQQVIVEPKATPPQKILQSMPQSHKLSQIPQSHFFPSQIQTHQMHQQLKSQNMINKEPQNVVQTNQRHAVVQLEQSKRQNKYMQLDDKNAVDEQMSLPQSPVNNEQQPQNFAEQQFLCNEQLQIYLNQAQPHINLQQQYLSQQQLHEQNCETYKQHHYQQQDDQRYSQSHQSRGYLQNSQHSNQSPELSPEQKNHEHVIKTQQHSSILSQEQIADQQTQNQQYSPNDAQEIQQQNNMVVVAGQNIDDYADVFNSEEEQMQMQIQHIGYEHYQPQEPFQQPYHGQWHPQQYSQEQNYEEYYTQQQYEQQQQGRQEQQLKQQNHKEEHLQTQLLEEYQLTYQEQEQYCSNDQLNHQYQLQDPKLQLIPSPQPTPESPQRQSRISLQSNTVYVEITQSNKEISLTKPTNSRRDSYPDYEPLSIHTQERTYDLGSSPIFDFYKKDSTFAASDHNHLLYNHDNQAYSKKAQNHENQLYSKQAQNHYNYSQQPQYNLEPYQTYIPHQVSSSIDSQSYKQSLYDTESPQFSKISHQYHETQPKENQEPLYRPLSKKNQAQMYTFDQYFDRTLNQNFLNHNKEKNTKIHSYEISQQYGKNETNPVEDYAPQSFIGKPSHNYRQEDNVSYSFGTNYNTSNYSTGNYNHGLIPSTTNIDSRYNNTKDINLQDGKSSSALLQEIRKITSKQSMGSSSFTPAISTEKYPFNSQQTSLNSKQDFNTFNSYSSASNSNFNLNISQKYKLNSLITNLNKKQPYQVETNSYTNKSYDQYDYQPQASGYESFNSSRPAIDNYNYGQNSRLQGEGDNGLTQNINNYSSSDYNYTYSNTDYTKEFGSGPANTKSYQTDHNLSSYYQYNDQLNDGEEYHVDFDPQILADIQKLSQ